MALPLVNELGMGTACLLFSITNCFTNFSIGYFGLFYTTPRPPTNKWLLFSGLLFIVIGYYLIINMIKILGVFLFLW